MTLQNRLEEVFREVFDDENLTLTDETTARETDLRLFRPASIAASRSHMKTRRPAELILIISTHQDLEILAREIPDDVRQ